MAEPLNLCELALAAGFVLYALFGGADFGGGIWTALAFGPRAQQQRDVLFDAIGPVWETNHVWLIFVVVTLFTTFPKGFEVLFTVLLTPLVVALIGINFRGAAFAFRHFGRHSRRQLPLTALIFEIASILTPFTLGIAVCALASGTITLTGAEPVLSLGSWLNPFTFMGGLVGASICAYLAPVYMTVRVGGELRQDFRKASISGGLVLGFLTAITIPIAIHEAPLFAGRLLKSWPLLFASLAVLAGTATQFLLWRQWFRLAQVGAGSTVILTLSGFAAALAPDLVIGQLPFAVAAAPRATLVAFLSVLPIGGMVLLPSLFYLFWTFRGEPNSNLPPAGTEP